MTPNAVNDGPTMPPGPGIETPARPAGGALLVDIRGLAALLIRSVASLERDQAAGRVPAPVYVGGSRRWRRAEIEAWVAAGCPARDRWDALRAAGRKEVGDVG